MTDIKDLYVSVTDTIRDLMKRIDRSTKGIVLAVDEQERFVATITDGDVRRAILAGIQLDSPAMEAMKTRNGEIRDSFTASAGTPRDEQLRLMRQHVIRHLPLLDSDGRVAQLATLNQEDLPERLPVQAVIMAGGFGKRLRPLTDHTPKPMLPIGGRPLMERTIENLRQAGIRRISITTHYMPEKIRGHFGSGDKYGVDLDYLSEDQPLGTAGALALVDETDEPLLVMNGDILTRMDYRELVSFHQERGADLTVGVRQYDIQVPYGVIDATNGVVLGLREKPKVEFLVNAGVYVLQPSARRRIPAGQRFDMTELIEVLLRDDCRVACFPIVEYWLDIGQHDDFLQAEADVRELKWAA